MKKILKFVFKGLYKIFVIIVYRPKIIGKENIPEDSGALICPNHVHALDSTVIIAMNKREINTLAKEELFKNKFFKFLGKLFGIYPVKLNNKSMESIKISLKLLKENKLLMIFPEGTRNGLERGIKPKDGAVKLAIKSGKPIVPIGIKGNFKPFKKIIINIGEPIYYNDYNEEISNKELLIEFTQELINKIIVLRDK